MLQINRYICVCVFDYSPVYEFVCPHVCVRMFVYVCIWACVSFLSSLFFIYLFIFNSHLLLKKGFAL